MADAQAEGPNVTMESRRRKIPMPRTRATETIRPSGATTSGAAAHPEDAHPPTPW